MKKLLLAPFLLASLFSFGGELKANPVSGYDFQIQEVLYIKINPTQRMSGIF